MKHFNLGRLKVGLLMLVSLLATSASAANFTNGSKLYLKPSDNWKGSEATFKAQFYNGNTSLSTVNMTEVSSGAGIYEATVPSGTVTKVDIHRYNNNGSSWWNKVVLTSAPTGSNNMVVINSDTWTNESGGGYTWSVYNAGSSEVVYKLHGQITGNTNWQDDEMTKGADGNWSKTGDFVVGEFGVQKWTNGNKGDWYAYTYIGSPADNCSNSEGNIKLTVAGNYTITFNPTTSKITVKQNGTEPPVGSVPASLHFRSDLNSWDVPATMTKNGNVFTYTKTDFEANKNVKFHFTEKGNKNDFSGIVLAPSTDSKKLTDNVAMDVDWVRNNLGDPQTAWLFSSTAKGTLTVTVDYTNAAKPTVKAHLEPAASTAVFKLHSNFFDSNWSDNLFVNGKLEVDLAGVTGTKEFGVERWIGSNKTWYAKVDDATITASNTYNVTSNSPKNFKINASNYTKAVFELVLDGDNLTRLTITLTKSANMFADELRLRTWQNNNEKDYVAVGQDGVYVFSIPDYTRDGNGDMWFRFDTQDSEGHVLKTYGWDDTSERWIGKNAGSNQKKLKEHSGEADKSYQFNGENNYTGALKIVADLNTMTVTITGEKVPATLYFVGDANQWLTTWPIETKDGKDVQAPVHHDVFPLERESGVNYCIKDFQFSPVEYAELPDGLQTAVTTDKEDWYKFQFPNLFAGRSGYAEYNYPRLWGQFKILTKRGYGDEFSCTEGESNLTAYYAASIDPNELVTLGKAGGQNFHLASNAIKNAVIYVNPVAKKMYITGEAENYYIYYIHHSDRDLATPNTNIKYDVNVGNPNTTNYYNNPVWGKDVKFTVYDLDNANAIPGITGSNEAGWKLPNGIELPMKETGGPQQIYAAQIPLGYELPGGLTWNITLKNHTSGLDLNAIDLALKNIYIGDPVHVHANHEFGDNADVEIYYRVYGIDSNYDWHIYSLDETGAVHNDILDITAAQAQSLSGESSIDNIGWVKLGKKLNISDYSNIFGGMHFNTSWMMSAGSGDGNGLQRVEIPVQHATKYVQFRVDVNKSGKENGPARIPNDGTSYSYYEPKSLTINVSRGEHKLNGEDLFYTVNTYTGIGDILDEANGEGAAPVYYNLQGVRVEEPAEGVYLEVRGNKTRKVVF